MVSLSALTARVVYGVGKETCHFPARRPSSAVTRRYHDVVHLDFGISFCTALPCFDCVFTCSTWCQKASAKCVPLQRSISLSSRAIAVSVHLFKRTQHFSGS